MQWWFSWGSSKNINIILKCAALPACYMLSNVKCGLCCLLFLFQNKSDQTHKFVISNQYFLAKICILIQKENCPLKILYIR